MWTAHVKWPSRAHEKEVNPLPLGKRRRLPLPRGRGISRSPVRRVLSNERDGPARSACRALYLGAAKYEKRAFRRKRVEIGEAFNPPTPTRQPRIVHRERPCIDAGVK